jgi:hypothetical protein
MRTAGGKFIDKALFNHQHDDDDDGGLFNCNSHILGKEASLPANFIVDLDVNQLYGHCGLYSFSSSILPSAAAVDADRGGRRRARPPPLAPRCS